MATTKLKGNPVSTSGELPKQGTAAPIFSLTGTDLSSISLTNYKGKKLILNIFPSIDTDVCAASVRYFNKAASETENSTVICISKDLPFAQARFCGAEGLDNVVMGSLMKSDQFGLDYGVRITDGPLEGLLARSIVVIDESGKVIYNQLVPEITEEPDYTKALSFLTD